MRLSRRAGSKNPGGNYGNAIYPTLHQLTMDIAGAIVLAERTIRAAKVGCVISPETVWIESAERLVRTQHL